MQNTQDEEKLHITHNVETLLEHKVPKLYNRYPIII